MPEIMTIVIIFALASSAGLRRHYLRFGSFLVSLVRLIKQIRGIGAGRAQFAGRKDVTNVWWARICHNEP